MDTLSFGEKESQIKTRRAIVNLLKTHETMDAHQLATELDVTAMAIRQHLYELQEKKIVTYKEEARKMGRPAKMWMLTPEANRLFPDGYADLTVSLIDSMKEAFGEDGLDRLLEVRNRKQIQHYLHDAPQTLSLKEQLLAIAESRTVEGFMAEIREDPNDDSYYLVEKHCPICAAAKACTDICKKELEMFQEVLGENVDIERGEHIIAGDNRCVYRITPK